MGKIRPMFQKEDCNHKEWRDAFMEYFGEDISLTTYSTANAIKIVKAHNCARYQVLMSYVLQFSSGGFWLRDGIMYVVTSGVNSDHEATYSDAVEFIQEWKEGKMEIYGV